MTSILSQWKRVFNATNSNVIISKSKSIFWIFFCISEIYIKFGTLWKIRWAPDVVCFWNYRLQKARLLKCPKSHVSEHLWTANMLKGLKHCINLHHSIFCHIFWSLWKKITLENSALVVSQILRLFLNILALDDTYSL